MQRHEAMIKVRFRPDQLEKWMRVAGIKTNAELARRMGTVTASTVSRFRRGETEPTFAIFAGLINTFPGLNFLDLFEFVDDEKQQGAA